MTATEASPLLGFQPTAGIDRPALAAEVAERRANLGREMAHQALEAVVVASEANCTYLTGYETTFWGNRSKPFAVVFAPPEPPTIVCHLGESVSVELDGIDVRVEPYAGPERLHVADTVSLDYQLGAAAKVAAVLSSLGAATVGLELSWHFLPGFTPMAMDALRRDMRAEVADASAALWHVRRRKSPWELEQMRRAAEVAELTHAGFAALARTGMSERELARLLRRCAYDSGAERIGYSGIIAGVDRAPLGGPTDRRWERGQLLFADICLQLHGGYFADFNRIYASSAPSSEERSAYASLVEALARGREVAAAGVPISELAAAMIGDYPTVYARVGHGLGLEMPEPPSLSPADDTPLQTGEVVCLEPNREVAGVGWLVSEEEVVVREGGCELLSPSFPAELGVIG